MGDLRAQVQALAGRGLSASEISSWLAVPIDDVRACLHEPVPGDGYDRTDEASFPASDPPPGPVR